MPRSTHDDFDEEAMFTAPATPPRRIMPPPAPMPVSAPASGNPLTRYFRLPGVHVSLPTNGAFLPPGTYFPAANGEVPIYPMGAGDDILLRSPDALMSGFAIEKLIESCVPAITSPLDISMPDLDVIFIGIRAADENETMEISVACPQCEKENTFDADLSALLATMKPIPPENTVRLADDVVAFIRPYNLRDATRVSIATFHETRRVQATDADTNLSDEAKTRAFNDSMRTINDLNRQIVASCVTKVVIPEGEVTDRGQIVEFIVNMRRNWFKRLDDGIKQVNSLGIDKTLPVTCAHCKHEWQMEVQFDPANFFGPAS